MFLRYQKPVGVYVIPQFFSQKKILSNAIPPPRLLRPPPPRREGSSQATATYIASAWDRGRASCSFDRKGGGGGGRGFWRWFAWWTHAGETDEDECEDECEGVKKKQVTTPLCPHHASRFNFLHMHILPPLFLAIYLRSIPWWIRCCNKIRQWDVMISYSNGWIWINGRSVMIFFFIEIASCWISHCLSLRRNARLRFYSIVSNFIIKAVSKARDARRRRWGRRRIEAWLPYLDFPNSLFLPAAKPSGLWDV